MGTNTWKRLYTRWGKPNIALIGFMGTGKSSTGKRLARFLDMKFVDTDCEIERKAGMTISQIFSRYGEAWFRELEAEQIRDSCALRGAVISTGGGAPLDPKNMELLKKNCVVVWMAASESEILKRVGAAESRPLLSGSPDPAGRVRDLLAARNPVYSGAHIRIDTDGLGLDEVVFAMVRALTGEDSAPVRSLRVDLGPRSYSIVVGEGLMDEIGERCAGAGLFGRCMLITNSTVGELYGERAESSLRRAGFDVTLARVPDGEEYKTLDMASSLIDTAVGAGLDRKSFVVALGGGVIGDLAGFVASVYMRGIPFVQVPTTLLAQVDSSVGGKVGVNHPKGKNLIGSFYQPKLVLADISTLRTLPERELRSGFAEVVKYGAIWDGSFFDYLESAIQQVFALDPDVIGRIVIRSCEIKAEIVAADEREEGIRALLNYGHTVGHALESATGYRVYHHGEAVAIGMVCAGSIAASLELLDREDEARIKELIRSSGLPGAFPGDLTGAVIEKLALDKKAVLGKPRFVLLRGIGQACVIDDVPGTVIEESISKHGYN